VSLEAYEQFLRPTLLVGLFAPPERISAAVMLETLYFYAMCSQNAFGELHFGCAWAAMPAVVVF
jgi:hypothetical protein